METKVINQERFKNYLRIRPFDGVNKSFFKELGAGKDLGHSLLPSASVNKKSIERFGDRFHFDCIFDEEFTQLEMFKEICNPLIEDLINLKKSSIVFSTGLTTSGKTYTIIGDSENPGLLPRSLKQIYEVVQEKKKNAKIEIYCNFFEIYDNNINDLLNQEFCEPRVEGTSTINTSLINLKNYKVDTLEDFSFALNMGNKRKKMKGKNSLSNIYFKIIVRFLNSDKKTYRDSSLLFLDTVYPSTHDFLDLTIFKFTQYQQVLQNKEAKYKSDEGKLLKIWEEFMFNVTASVRTERRSFTKGESFCKVLKPYIHSANANIVHILNLKPHLACEDENLKVLLFSYKLEKFIERNETCQVPYKVKEVDCPIEAAAVSLDKSKSNSSSVSLKPIEKVEPSASNKSNQSPPIAIVNTDRKQLQDISINIENLMEDYDKLKKKYQEQDKLIKDLIKETQEKEKRERELRMEKQNREKMEKESIKKINSTGVNLIQNNNLNNNLEDTNLNNEISSLSTFIKNLVLPNSRLRDNSLEIERTSNTKLFNVILVNPTIQNLTISNNSENDAKNPLNEMPQTKNDKPLTNNEMPQAHKETLNPVDPSPLTTSPKPIEKVPITSEPKLKTIVEERLNENWQDKPYKGLFESLANKRTPPQRQVEPLKKKKK